MTRAPHERGARAAPIGEGVRFHRNLAAALVGVAGLAAIAAGAASGELVQAGKLIVNVDGGFHPTTLPKKQFAPVSLNGSAEFSTTDGSLPPTPAHVQLDFDRNGKQTNRGLPVCQPARLENTVVADARRACKSAIVGTGSAAAKVLFPGETTPIPADSPITAFNGPNQGAAKTLIIHAYTTVPVPTTFVVPVSLTKINAGRYGLRATTDPPPIAGGYGHLTHFDLTINRRYTFKGQQLSYASARCLDGRLQARGTATFDDGTVLSGQVLRPCKSRG